MLNILGNTSCTDYGLFAAIILSTSFVYNKGRFLPRTDRSEKILYEKVQKQDAATSSSSATRDMGEKVRTSDAQFIILWGSQSGTAEGLAQRLKRDIQQRFSSQVVLGDLSDYDPATVANIPGPVFLVLIMSTYGEGDPSDNAQDFVTYLTSTPNANLAQLRFAAFGCGNSSYRYFNQVIYDTASALEHRGAKAIVPVGTGDEAKRSTLEDFHDWKAAFFSTLVSQYALSERDIGYQPAVQIELEAPSSKATENSTKSTLAKVTVVSLPTVSNLAVAQYVDPLRSCVHIKLDLSSYPQIKYRTGDHIAVWPRNPKDEVDNLLRIMQKESQSDYYMRITSKDELVEMNFPSTMTLHDLLSKHLDICAPVPRETILVLARMAKTPEVKQELERIGSTKEAYAIFLDSHHMTLARLLCHISALHPSSSWDWLPLSFLVDLIPPLKPRLYSIGSSSIVDPKHVSLVVSVKPQPIPGRPDTLIHGLTSTFLARLPLNSPEESLVQAEIRRSDFKLPFNTETPVIMVAAGTGIAPFRAFVHERARLASIGRPVGPMLLFFGCQNQADCLFYDELTELAATHASRFELQLYTAFSRQPSAKTKYVQDQLFEHRQSVMKYLIEDDAGLYICGATAMAKEVRKVLLEAAMVMKQWTSSEAEQWRQGRRKAKRWNEDVWS
ncbi:uncharacterized protein B0I36DRAFT_425751 [Microdochium trichocladiopsis]|uniref:NADPH--cytochrome P450 reductase n=1 Tax=Microdochium trichocladiopsis TaxID=1682393 RepID=A0A9P9BIC9_9PEZI|nr:uncharacterized protein B0I36DRAFT_425751 [Microdochium trichocladiopsis]KAH7014235.1 hypothetical protein B0I36DRAFT_425751 [Microdochium trichocladiopsis]